MKTVVLYASVHHGNTKKIVDAIQKETLCDIIDATKYNGEDLSIYDRVIIASGVYFAALHNSISLILKDGRIKQNDVRLILTSGSNSKKYIKKISDFYRVYGVVFKSTYICKGYDTYGPFKLIGGIAKNHPNNDEIQRAVQSVL